MSDLIDLNKAFGEALLQQFFEPIVVGRDSNTGQPYYAQSGVSRLATQIYQLHSEKILDAVWEQLDLDDLATKIATQIVNELSRVPGSWLGPRNVRREEITARVQEIVAQELGQRAVNTMTLKIEEKGEPE